MRFMLLLVLAACVPAMVRPMPASRPGQEVTYSGGAPTIISFGPNSSVAVGLLTTGTGRYELAGRVGFTVALKNDSDQRIDVSESSVKATANGVPAAIFTAAQMEDEIRAHAAYAQAVNAFAYVVAASTTKDRALVHRYAHDAAGAANAIEAEKGTALENLSGLLQRTTLPPGRFIAGALFVYVDRRSACPMVLDEGTNLRRPGPCRLELVVTVGDDEHGIAFDETPGN